MTPFASRPMLTLILSAAGMASLACNAESPVTPAAAASTPAVLTASVSGPITGPIRGVVPGPGRLDPAPQEEGEKKAITPEALDRLIRHARSGSAMIRPQAAERLLGVGAPALERIKGIAGDDNAKFASLGSAIIEVLGGFNDEGLRLRLWLALEDSEFPWRPAAARSLADTPWWVEWDRIAPYTEDPIAPVRAAALDALFMLSLPVAPGERPEAAGTPADEKRRIAEFPGYAVARLADENDVVRRKAALHLDARGHGRAILWLLEDLKRGDTFFDMPTGEAARYAAMAAFDDLGIDLGNYNPELPYDSTINVPELAAIEARIRARAERMERRLPEEERTLVPAELPAVALASHDAFDAPTGLLLKSCRRGDYYLRWTTDDQLLVGAGNPARIQLAEGATQAVLDAARETEAATAAQGKFYWGTPGCDMESFRLPNTLKEKGGIRQLIISKGEGIVEDLRPAPLSALGAAMASTIPSDDALKDGDPRTRALASRLRAAFVSVGGPVETSPMKSSEVPADSK